MQPEYLSRLNRGPVQPNLDGTVSTHRMAWGSFNGKYIAFPTLVPDELGRLVQPPNPMQHAIQNRNFMEFNSQQEAEAYASGAYKKGTGLEKGYQELSPIDAYLQRIYRNRIPQ